MTSYSTPSVARRDAKIASRRKLSVNRSHPARQSAVIERHLDNAPRVQDLPDSLRPRHDEYLLTLRKAALHRDNEQALMGQPLTVQEVAPPPEPEIFRFRPQRTDVGIRPWEQASNPLQYLSDEGMKPLPWGTTNDVSQFVEVDGQMIHLPAGEDAAASLAQAVKNPRGSALGRTLRKGARSTQIDLSEDMTDLKSAVWFASRDAAKAAPVENVPQTQPRRGGFGVEYGFWSNDADPADYGEWSDEVAERRHEASLELLHALMVRHDLAERADKIARLEILVDYDHGIDFPPELESPIQLYGDGPDEDFELWAVPQSAEEASELAHRAQDHLLRVVERTRDQYNWYMREMELLSWESAAASNRQADSFSKAYGLTEHNPRVKIDFYSAQHGFSEAMATLGDEFSARESEAPVEEQLHNWFQVWDTDPRDEQESDAADRWLAQNAEAQTSRRYSYSDFDIDQLDKLRPMKVQHGEKVTVYSSVELLTRRNRRPHLSTKQAAIAKRSGYFEQAALEPTPIAAPADSGIRHKSPCAVVHITEADIRHASTVYLARHEGKQPSLLTKPYNMADDAMEYRAWLRQRWQQNPAVRKELEALAAIIQGGGRLQLAAWRPRDAWVWELVSVIHQLAGGFDFPTDARSIASAQPVVS